MSILVHVTLHCRTPALRSQMSPFERGTVPGEIGAPSLAGERIAAIGSEGSPACNLERRLAPLAQSAERLHGKEKVYGSIP